MPAIANAAPIIAATIGTKTDGVVGDADVDDWPLAAAIWKNGINANSNDLYFNILFITVYFDACYIKQTIFD